MPSVATSIIGGFQSASAAKNAAKKTAAGYRQAGTEVTEAVRRVNPQILQTAHEAGLDVEQAALRAGEGAVAAGEKAGAGAVTAADRLTGMLQPYIGAGERAIGRIEEGMAPGGALAQPFTASMMAQYSPAYQFQLAQGREAAQKAAAAAGVGASGGTMRSLNRYAQDFAGTAFERAEGIYSRQQRDAFNRLATLAGGGAQAAGQAGQAGLQAAEYAGSMGANAAQYAGTMGVGGTQFRGTADINARNLVSGNELQGAGYLANTQIEAQKALAQGDLGAAAAWNQMLSGIGKAGDTLLFGGMGGAPGTTSGWSWGNIGPNIWGQGGGAGTGGGWMNTGSPGTLIHRGAMAAPAVTPAGGEASYINPNPRFF